MSRCFITDDAIGQVEDIIRYINGSSGYDLSTRFFNHFDSIRNLIAMFPEFGQSLDNDFLSIRKMRLPAPFGDYVVYWVMYQDEPYITYVTHTSRLSPDAKDLMI